MDSLFIFAACKFGYERDCKDEILGACPHLRFSYSRPGFLTFKVTEGAADFSVLNGLTFVRTSGINLGKSKLVDGNLESNAIDEVASAVQEKHVKHLHFWSRELGATKDEQLLEFSDGTLPEGSPFASQLAERLNLKLNQKARNNDYVLDLIQIDSDEIWTALHKVESPQQGWPGGIIRFSRPEKMVSRAYLKTRESMLWSRFPFQPNELCIELGSAPGGSGQALLESQLKVIGIDPADIDPELASHAAFTHFKKRGADVKKKLLSGGNWLFADSNVAPEFTLDMVEDIATNQHVHLKGMILTLKLLEHKLTKDIQSFRDRVKQMGFQYVRTRQLAFNRNEICLAALKRKSLLRFGKKQRPASPDAEPGNSDKS